MINTLNKKNYIKIMLYIGLPITLQALLQSSLSIIDQVMVSNLGEINISGIGFAFKVCTILFFFSSSAIAGSCGIMLSQYFAKKDNINISKAFKSCLIFNLVLGIIFFTVCIIFSYPLISLFSKDTKAVEIGAEYLKIIAIGFIPVVIADMIASYFRSQGKVKIITIIAISMVVINTILNYVFIYGKLGMPELGARGAALATIIANYVYFILLLIIFLKDLAKLRIINFKTKLDNIFLKMALRIVLPFFICEFIWSLGESVYGSIYGHIGTNDSAAMNLIGPIIGLSVGLFSGISQAASVMVGNRLGVKDDDTAFYISKKLLLLGIIGTLTLGVILILLSNIYVNIFKVENYTKYMAKRLIVVFALVLWIKVSNMVLGGIIKSGGKTYYQLGLNILGNWCIGVPLGYLSLYVFKLSIEYTYLLISVEELVRLIIALMIFKRKKWMQQLK